MEECEKLYICRSDDAGPEAQGKTSEYVLYNPEEPPGPCDFAQFPRMFYGDPSGGGFSSKWKLSDACNTACFSSGPQDIEECVRAAESLTTRENEQLPYVVWGDSFPTGSPHVPPGCVVRPLEAEHGASATNPPTIYFNNTPESATDICSHTWTAEGAGSDVSNGFYVCAK